jgi:membrane protease YdiL (CAAX protease family)
VNNRGITRARLVFGALMLFAAVVAWATALLMSPHSDNTVNAAGTEHVRQAVVVFLRNSAIGTLVLSALAAWLLFPERRPRKQWRDYAIMGVLAVLVLSSLYQLVWLRTVTS